MSLQLFAFLLIAAPPMAPKEVPPFFSVDGVNQTQQSGRLVKLSPEFTATLSEDGLERTIPEIISFRRVAKAVPTPPTGPQLVTATGDRIAGTVTGGDSQFLLFLPDFLGKQKADPWKVPFASVGVLWLTTTPADTPLDPNRYDWLEGNRNRDVIRLRNGDVDRGTLLGVEVDDSKSILSFRPEKGAARKLKSEDLSAVGFNPSLARTRKPKGPYAQLVLADSSRLSLFNVAVKEGILTGETLFGEKTTLPLKEVLSLNVLQGQATYLSDLKPRKVEQLGFLGVSWPWAPDRTVRGTSLRLMTDQFVNTFDKGIGTHPRTALTYDLGGKFRRFDAIVGLDPSANIRSQAILRVLVDGKEQEIAGLPPVSPGKSIPIEVNVKGAKELVLITDFGPNGGVGADVNWCDARLVE